MMLCQKRMRFCFPFSVDDQISTITICSHHNGFVVKFALTQARSFFDCLEKLGKLSESGCKNFK